MVEQDLEHDEYWVGVGEAEFPRLMRTVAGLVAETGLGMQQVETVLIYWEAHPKIKSFSDAFRAMAAEDEMSAHQDVGNRPAG